MKMTNFGEFLEEFVCDLADRVKVSRFYLSLERRRGEEGGTYVDVGCQ
jgi:hypothetical protein